MNVTKRILIAEDQETERIALREILRAEPGWDITEAKDGQEAMDLLCDRFHPDVCLLDLRMPKLDGLEMLQRMRRDPLLRDIKVVVTSSNRDKDTIVALAKLKISGYILKPYSAEKTLATLRPVLASVAANPALVSKNLLVRTALIADDNATERAALKEIFKRQPGWELIQAIDGQDALDKLHAGLRPDLLMVDLRMPKLDGFAFIQRVREDVNLRKLRVVVVSSDHDREQVRALAQLSIAGYLLKPFDEAKVKVTLLQAAGIEVNQTPASDIIEPPSQLQPTPSV
ncbi:MAG: response regulator [Verrucomicrobia bacterium]|nr:response regulator [Verrucomicrobiota bacterium]